jgi:hypothetical protein
MSLQDRLTHPDRFENEEDWLDLYDDDPADPRHLAADERTEANLLDEMGLDWTDMDNRPKIDIALDVADVDDPAEDEIAA